jgi:hypothetical protein
MNISLKQALSLGTLPKAATSPKTAPKFLRTYVETYLKEEIKQEALVRRLDIFVRFLELAAQLNAEPINYSKIAKGIGSTHVSVENYFSILAHLGGAGGSEYGGLGHLSGDDGLAVLRGGGWGSNTYAGVFSAELGYSPSTNGGGLGFRCAVAGGS